MQIPTFSNFLHATGRRCRAIVRHITSIVAIWSLLASMAPTVRHLQSMESTEAYPLPISPLQPELAPLAPPFCH
jgi:hypothetical protein